MSFHDDILEDADKLLGVTKHDFSKPHANDPLKVFSYKIKGTPGKDSSVSIGQDITEKDGKLAHKQKMEFKTVQGEFEAKWTATNKDYKFETEWTPKDLQGDVSTYINAEAKLTPKGKEDLDWEGTVGVHSSGIVAGPTVNHVGLDFSTNRAGEHELSLQQTHVYEKDFVAASNTVIDVNNKKLGSAFGILQWRNQEWGQAWFRSNCMANFMGLGWQGKVNGWDSAAEVQYDYKKANTGLNGQPIWLKLGLKSKLNNGGSWQASLASGQQHIAEGKVEMPLDGNVKVTYQDKMNLVNAFTDPANINYQYGFNVEFKM